MRPRIPPLLPTYVLLVLVVVFAAGSLWVGLGQLDTIERLAESRAESAATVQELQSLASTLNDIVTSAQGYARNGASENLDLFERARRTVPTQLTRLRDRMRDSPSELALVERLVPLIARTTALADAAIEHLRSAPASEAPEAPAAYRDSVEAIRVIIANLESRERDDLAHDGRALTAALSSAQILQFALAGLSVLLVGLLFVAARRLSSFIPPAPRVDAAASVDLGGESPAASNARIAMLLDDAVARARLAAVAAARDDPAAVESLRSSIEAIERTALAPHGEPRPGASTVVDGLALLARAYSQPGGLTVEPTLDRSVAISGREKAFVVDRVAEWGLEAIARRKRSGEITLVFSGNEDDASLRLLALLDPPDVPLRLSPREREETDFLQRAAASLGGRLVVTHGPTGFALVLTLPLDS
ncbi:MAG TPA: CHASE3 domain-containing protein [Casimicrobiaceae bacterium]|nr:CHASE3 domain-containing protein [Casimicrobiaceae bacterium]